MSNPLLFSLSETRARLIEAKQIICNDPMHFHRSPIQNMFAVDVNGWFVEITQDGEYFNARIDERIEGDNLTPEQLLQFIKDHT